MLKKSFTSFFQESRERPVKKKYWSPKKIKSVKENLLTFKKHYQLINEGGQAAENLIVDLKKNTSNENLKYVRANPTPEVIDEIQRLLTLLRSKGFVDSREPSYYLGSSRLFAIKAGIRVPEPNEIETREIIQKALSTKKDFGDIDLDVYFQDGISTKDIKDFLNSEFPGKYAANTSGDEVNTAVVVGDSNNVIQIDIVNIKGKEKYFGVSQFASMADIVQGIKGVVRDLLIRGIASTTLISPQKQQILDKLVKSSPKYKEFEKKYEGKEITFDIRYTLGLDGLAYRINWMVDGISKSYTKEGVKLDQLHRFLNDKIVQPVSYDNLETLAEILGFKNPQDLKHVVKMAELVSTFNQERKQKIWDNLVKNIKIKLPKLTDGHTQGQISHKEAKNAFNVLKPYFGNVDTTEYSQLFGESLNEAVKMVSIPHIDQMTAKDFCNLFSGGAWEVSEKYDGSNVSFGLTEDSQIFVRSKKVGPFTNSQEFYFYETTYNNPIMGGMGRLLESLQKSKVEILLKQLGDMIGAPLQIFGELFSEAHMNVIPYAEDLIGNGAVVIFGVIKLDSSKKGTDITTTKEGKVIKDKIIKFLNNSSDWKFYDKKPLDLNIDDAIKSQIQKTCSAENMATMKSLKRDDSSKEMKAKAVKEFEILKSLIKKNLLSSLGTIPSSLGASEIEGAIIRNMETGAIAKLVDLEGFGRRRSEQWAGVGVLKDYRKNLFTKLQRDVLQNADIFVLSSKQLEKIRDSEKPVKNINDILEVFYGDAVQEVEFKEAKQMVTDLIDTLNTHKKQIQNALLEVDPENKKAVESTKNLIAVENKTIDNFINKLKQDINNQQNPYLSVIRFVIGDEGLQKIQDIILNKINKINK